MSRRKNAAVQNALSLVPPPAQPPVVRAIDINALSDVDLMALAAGWPTLDASHAVGKAGGLKPLLRKDTAALETDGLEYGMAAQLVAMAEVARRIARPGESRPVLTTPEDIYAFLAPELAGKGREEFWVLALNSRNVLLRAERVAVGSATSCAVDPRDLFAVALATKAAGIVVSHNHPSGDPTPSRADIELTRQLMRGAELLCIRFLDHIIIGDWQFASMAKRGDLADLRP